MQQTPFEQIIMNMTALYSTCMSISVQRHQEETYHTRHGDDLSGVCWLCHNDRNIEFAVQVRVIHVGAFDVKIFASWYAEHNANGFICGDRWINFLGVIVDVLLLFVSAKDASSLVYKCRAMAIQLFRTKRPLKLDGGHIGSLFAVCPSVPAHQRVIFAVNGFCPFWVLTCPLERSRKWWAVDDSQISWVRLKLGCVSLKTDCG